MKNFTNFFLTFSFLFLITLSATATHNRAGEITFRQIGNLTFEISCTTFTKTSSLPADRDSLNINFGDGSSEFVMRSNGNGLSLPNDIKLNIYTTTHTYAGTGQYSISMTDPNRNGGIINIPNSDQVPFYLETMLEVLNINFQGTNNSPLMLQPPVDIAYQGQTFKHTPNAFDIDGDSIAYELIDTIQSPGSPVVNYTFPHNIDNQLFSFNEITGEYIWITPQTCGEYHLAILVKEYRAGQLISTVIRDMQILVQCLNNRPPTVTTTAIAEEICVFAGESINFDIITDDLDAGQLNLVTANGGPFLIQSPAQLLGSNTYQSLPTNNQFVWQTNCKHIRKEPYQIVFKAQDDFEGTLGAIDLKIILIRVLPPLPENMQTNVQPTMIELTWDNPYFCDTLIPFNAFSIWRQECTTALPIDSCTLDLRTENYTMIANNISTLAPDGSGKYYYADTSIENGKVYCYRVLSDFLMDFSVETKAIIKNDFSVNYYPNPIKNGHWLNVDIPENRNDLAYEIHNLLGQKMAFGVLDIQGQTLRIKMPEQDDIYIVTLLEAGQKVKSFKVIVGN